MSSYDALAAADTANMQAGGTSFFDDATNFFTQGVPGAVVSGLYAIANTPIDLTNKVFGTDYQTFDTAKTLTDLNDNWGTYYNNHQGAVDNLGLAIGSLVPGTAAIKGLKAFQAGKSFGAFGSILRATSSQETFYLNAALKDLATEGGSVFSKINANKLASMAWGTADSTLQMAAYGTATAATMYSSPMFDNKDLPTIGWDILSSSLYGGAFGGTLNALFTNKLIKNAGLLVTGKQRMYDVLRDTGSINVSAGDKMYEISDALLSLPKEVLDPVVKLNTGREGISDSLDLTKLLTGTLRDTAVRGITKFENSFTNLVEDDPTVGAAFGQGLISLVKQGLDQSATDPAIRTELGNVLFNLKKVTAVGSNPPDISEGIRYLNPTAEFTKIPVLTGETTPGSIALRVIGNPSQAKMAVLGTDVTSAADAWKLGFDFLMDPGTKTVSVSPVSTIYAKLSKEEMGLTPVFINTRTMATGFTVSPTIADVATTLRPLEINATGVQSGSHTFAFSTAGFEQPATALEATARHAWAADRKVFSGEIQASDISVLDALLKDPTKAADGLTIWDDATKSARLFSDINNFDSYVFKQKLALAQKMLTGTDVNLQELSQRLNVSGDWLENAIATRFDAKKLYENAGWKQSLDNFKTREHVIAYYDTQGMQNAANMPNAIIAYTERLKEATAKAQDASAAVLGDVYKQLPELDALIASTADQQATGPTLLAASNAGYLDKLRASTQYIGSIVDKTIRDRASAAASELQGPAIRVRQSPAVAAELASLTTSFRLSDEGIALWTDPLSGERSIVDLASRNKIAAGGEISFEKQIPLQNETADFLESFKALHDARQEQQSVLAAAQGQPVHWDPLALYLPPVNTSRLTHFAFVRQQEGSIFSTSDVGMITARSAPELQQLAAQVQKDTNLQVIYKGDTEAYHKAKGDFDITRTLNSPQINSFLKKQGLLGDYLPSMTPEAILDDYIQYTMRQEAKLVRDAVSVNYAQPVAELQDLSDRYTAAQLSQFNAGSKWTRGSLSDPFKDTINLMLNKSKQGEFTLWHQANEFIDALGTRAFRGLEKSFLAAKGGQITWQQANAEMERWGIGAHFADDTAFKLAQTAPEQSLISIALQKANMLLATGMLRFDTANSIVNMVSTPIMAAAQFVALRRSIMDNPELLAAFDANLSEQVPGTAVKLPSFTRLLFKAVGNSVGEGSAELMQRYKDINVVKGPAALFHQLIEDVSLTRNIIPGEYAAKVDKWVEKAADSKLFFGNQAEDYTRFVTADIARQMTDPIVAAGRMSIPEQNTWISLYTNQVQGNYIASQRPILFQGVLGRAIGLFQTYQFNLYQQLFRHIENKDGKAIATLAGMQTALFGLNGLPLFDAINTHIVGTAGINSGHKDAYTAATEAFGTGIGNWMMYGTASAFPLFGDKAPALYSRGDLNPRNLSIIPINPMDVPAVQVSLKTINTAITIGKQISQGASGVDALLFGLEHNGVSRPLAGIAQLAKGSATTSKGDLIANASDWNSIATFSRLLGAKPLDESIGLNTLFKSNVYKAYDKQRTDELGTVIKDKLRNNQQLSPEDWAKFQSEYASYGGRIDGFAAAINRWDTKANSSVVNQLASHMETAQGSRLAAAMGGDVLPDFSAP